MTNDKLTSDTVLRELLVMTAKQVALKYGIPDRAFRARFKHEIIKGDNARKRIARQMRSVVSYKHITVNDSSTRVCLRCDKQFLSVSKFNRLCNSCKGAM